MTLPAGSRERYGAENDDVCLICGRTIGANAFCHVYFQGRRVSLCGPTCAEDFIEQPDSPLPDETHFSSGNTPSMSPEVVTAELRNLRNYKPAVES